MSEQPVTTCETCGAPVTIQGDTTLHYQPVSEQDRYGANIVSYVQAATRRTERAESALQTAQAENAALRKALAFVQADIQGRHMTTAEQVCAEALSGDAGAAFLAKYQAMTRVCDAAEPIVRYVTERRGLRWTRDRMWMDGELADAIEAVVDALSAPAAEPEVNDV